MDYTMNMFKKIGNYTYDKTVKAKDYIVEKSKDEKVRKSIKDGVGAGINGVKNATNKTINYFQDSNLKENLKNDISNGYNVTKEKTINGIETISNPTFYVNVKDTVVNSYNKAEENVIKGKEYFDNYIVIDFKNLKPNQIEYLTELPDQEVNRRFSEDEVFLINKLKKEKQERLEKERLEKENNLDQELDEHLNQNNNNGKPNEDNENIELEIDV